MPNYDFTVLASYPVRIGYGVQIMDQFVADEADHFPVNLSSKLEIKWKTRLHLSLTPIV